MDVVRDWKFIALLPYYMNVLGILLAHGIRGVCMYLSLRIVARQTVTGLLSLYHTSPRTNIGFVM
jgi:hypothetical protein